LPSKHNDGVIEPGFVNGFDGRRIERLAQVDVADLGADMGSEPGNIETCLRRDVHVFSSRERDRTDAERL
jgi:hypothetical protein